MDLTQFLRSRLGAARTADLKRAGFPERTLASALSNGVITRLQRGVYVTKGADPDVVAAFRANGRLTCISAARFYGLWGTSRTRNLALKLRQRSAQPAGC
ncbi:type IV toxin-antitoxin system AbiEi family antitoxin domain-containing protein [Paenarthrobacter nicotinovorans]|uniref:type IV toxin-antitoxin system AbiEi family antitoxin domain-containing protein n=1 Tax=Paenarthrobacter nicotinovorans TaxID=29320 RepID=UPI0031BBBA80